MLQTCVAWRTPCSVPLTNETGQASQEPRRTTHSQRTGDNLVFTSHFVGHVGLVLVRLEHATRPMA